MKQNPKKGKVAASNLIALGNSSKPRYNNLSLASTVKKVKTDDLNPKTFLTSIDQTVKQENGGSETTLINFLNSIKTVLITSNKPIKTYLSQCLAIFVICKKYPSLFTKPVVLDCLVNILSYNGKESSSISSLANSFKPQSSTQVNPSSIGKIKPFHIAICNIILFSLKDVIKWPIQLVKAYLEDSFGDRIWVDLPECYLFVQNIETAFPSPGIDPRTLFPMSAFSDQMVDVINSNGDDKISIPTEQMDHSELRSCNALNKILTGLTAEELLKSRYDHCKPSIDAMIAGYIKDILDRRFMADTQSRPIIRTFCTLAAIPEVRGAAVAKSDNWLSTGKLQSSTLNMLTIMANSCAQNVMHNTHDVNFCAYFMLKFKYKLSKPPVQSILLECVRKITETHPCNLRNLLEIYINNEIYGTPTAAAAASNITGTVGNPCPIAYIPQNKSGPASVTFPAVYFRFPSESIKILGELLHEQISVLHHDIKPVKLFIRDICRWIKLAYINSNGVYTPFASSSSNGALPDSLELHDLAQNLLVDRSNSEALTSRMTDGTFKQLYVENMINIVCELQMLSVVRPTVREAFKERVDQEKKDYEALKSHFNTLRQIRYFTCKWLKNIFRIVESHVSADQMTNYIKQVLFLNVTRNNDFTYIVDESYGIGDIWNNETDKMFLVRGLTEIPISDKLVQTLINLGFEKNLCFRPSEIVNMISELIVRASASACTEIIPMNVSKCEAMINNMFACCSYDVVLHESDPNLQIARTLAYKSSFWKVCQALVVMASHCMTTVGALLWSNFPTVKNLMQIIITNNFDELSNDKEAMDKERQLCEIDSKKIIELESKISENSLDDIVMVDANSSKLVNLLLFNLPQGPIRQPPSHIVESLKSINQIMKIGDRLSQCRNPDFLFEIVREQDQNKISSRKWIIDLVKKTSEHNLDCLPLLVLTEFIYHDIYEKIINNLPVVSRNDTKDGSLKRLVHKLRSILCVTETDKKAMDKETLKNIVGALSNSFFNRLSDSSAFIRKVARECLYILLLPISHPIKLMESSLEFVDTLKSIMNLNILQDNSLICSVAEALRETLKFETDIDVLHSYIDLFAFMSTGNHKEWLANTVETLSILILNRPIIADKLRTADNETLSKGKTSTTLICDSLAEIFLAHINYTAYQAKVVPLEHREEAVMVTIKDKQFPVVVKVIQSQLALACWGVSKSKKSKKLIDFWFCKVNTSNKYQLTSFTNIESNAPVTDIIPDWLVNAAVHSGIVSVMSGILNHHVAVNGKISHSLTPALYFMSNDFIKSYLNYMNSIVKSELTMIETWLSQCSEKLLSGMLATVTRMYSKVVKPAAAAVDILFKTTLETHHHHHHHLVPKYQNLKTAKMPNLEPKIIVKPIENRRKIENPEITARMEIDDIDNVWSTVVQAYSISTITECISKLLASKSFEIVKGIENLFKLLKDPKTHSETLKILNKSDFKLMPLLKLSFRSYDQESFDFGMQSFRYLFKSYPHIEKSSLWKMIYNLSLVQGLTVGNIGNVGNGGGGDVAVAVAVEMSDGDQYHHHHHQLQWKSLAKSIMQGGTEDAGQIGPKIDQLTILGLGNGHFTESHFDLLHKLLFSSHSLNQYSDYFMSDLLHQSNAFCLRQILHSILNRKTITQLNASRVLDFITACLHHPRLQYSVVLPVSNQYIWPQQNSEIDLSESELIALLNLVVCEAEHLIEQNGPTAKCVNRSLVKRSDLIDICSSSKSLIQQRNLIINRFIDWKSPHNEAVDKFGFALYCRLPNLMSDKYQAAANNQQQQQQPMEMEREKEALTVTDVDRYNLKEIHRIGQRLLAGLVSPRNDLQDMAIQGCKALVTKHPKLSLQLLPYMCALSDGALDGTDSWNEFRKKRSPVLYSNLLHLLEIMIPVSNINSTTSATIRGNMKIILFNFLRVLIRYRDEHKFFIGFVTRLVGFMEKMIPLEKKLVEDIVSCCCEEEVKNENREEKENGDFIIEHATEITALSKIYPQFRNLIVYVQKNKEICSSLLSASSTGELDDNRASQLPLLKLELLVNFRKKLRETLTGNGILMQIKDLDDVSRRDTNIIGLFLDDLRRLINHSMNDVRIAAVQVLARYLNAFPEQANRIIGDFILSNMLKSVSYWSRPFVNLTLKTLCQTGMLTPNVVPLCLTNHARLYVTGNNGRGNYRESIELLEVIIDNISLESFMESVGSYNGKPMLKKDNINQAQKRGFLDNDGDNHKAKRSRFK